MSNKKLLILQNSIMKYREELFNILAEKYDVTVAYGIADKTSDETRFKKLKFPVKMVGPLKIYGGNFIEECRKYDIIVTNIDLHNPQFCYLPMRKKGQLVLTWGIGLRASYTRLYDVDRRHQILDHLYGMLLKRADANLTYMTKAREFWRDTTVDPDKFFTAVNTVPVMPLSSVTERDSLLFVGSIYKAKGIDKLIDAFIKATTKSDSKITLNIVGGGDEALTAELKKQVAEAGVADRVNFIGPVYDESELAKYFARAIACISPDQAGLTVPKAMGYGVAMVTKRNAISGGEIYHIADGATGCFYNEDTQLPEIISDILSNPDKYQEIGKAAREYYTANATPRHQAQGFFDAIDFAESNNTPK